jgi:tetratricopeptide (TPR) repeat protein
VTALLLLLLAQGPGPAAVPEALAEGDAHYALRHEGARGGAADPHRIDLAIAAYRRALSAAPDDRAALTRLLRALFFRGAFCGATAAEQKAIYEEARGRGQAAVDRLEAPLRGRPDAERLAALHAIPHAALTYFWTAVHWGQWALARGKLTAARQGVAGRVRDLAETVIALDPALEEGGGYRVLGRLHDESPRIPFVTGWVSKRAGLEALRKAYAAGPTNPVTWFFLGEAIVEHDAPRRAEGLALLRRCAESPPRADYLVESAHYAELARARLARER